MSWTTYQRPNADGKPNTAYSETKWLVRKSAKLWTSLANWIQINKRVSSKSESKANTSRWKIKK